LGCNAQTTLDNQSGSTLKSRFNPPPGFQRTAPRTIWEKYLQNFELEAVGSPVLDYKGQEISEQQSHAAVLKIDVGTKDLQQCADALIRLRAEFLWKENRKDEIAFAFTSGDVFAWNNHAAGYRPKVRGNQVNFVKTEAPDESYAAFRNYLNYIFMYAGTISLTQEMTARDRGVELEIGDVIISPGSPGHTIMVADKSKNEHGNCLYVLIQGFTPAQSVHVIRGNYDRKSAWSFVPKSGGIDAVRYYFSKPLIRTF
jgi:hypothetical protein